MKIYFLKHSGFAVDTGKRLIVFDYFFDMPEGGTLEQGVITPELLADKPLTVFASHFHQDHYNKVILDWPRRHPDCTLYLGKGIRSGGIGRTVRPYEDFTENGIHIRTLRSTDSGVAFLVQADGLNIYHAGDLNWWHWGGEPDSWNRDMAVKYKKEIDSISSETFDAAFLPTDPRQEQYALLGAQYFLEHISVRHWVPIHCWEDTEIFSRLKSAPELANYQNSLLILNQRGQCAEV